MTDLIWWVMGGLAGLLLAYILFKIYEEVSKKYRLKKITKSFHKVCPHMMVILDHRFNVVIINNYNPTLVPYLERELLNVNLWGLLPPDLAAVIHNGYKKAKNLSSAITVDYSRKNKKYEFDFQPLHENYVACFIREVFPA